MKGRHTLIWRTGLLAMTVVAFSAGFAGSAQASPGPWWNLNTSLRPAELEPGGEGTLVLRGTNVGDAPTAGAISLSAQLPPNLSVVESEGVPQIHFYGPLKAPPGFDFGPTGFLGFLEFCQVSGSEIRCTFSKPGPPNEFFDEFYETFLESLAPFESFEMQVAVKDEGASGGNIGTELNGGGASAVSSLRPLRTGETPFGAEALALVPEAEGGVIDTRAGAHPFQLTNTFNLNQSDDPARPPAMVRSLRFKLPPGQLGNARAFPKCSGIDYATELTAGANLCPVGTQLGVAVISYDEPATLGLRTEPVPLFNLEPKRGEPARFGFTVLKTPVILDTSVRSGNGEDYGVTVSSSNITEVSNLISSTVTFWGVPGDPRHDESRGWGCIASGHYAESGLPCTPATEKTPPAFLTAPTDCGSPFVTSVEGASWTDPGDPLARTFPPFSYSLEENGTHLALTGCNQLPFAPRIQAEPTSNAATSPTGFNFDITVDDEGLISSEGRAQSQIKKAVVRLPQGFTTNPSVAEGLKACSQGEFEAAAVQAGTGCTPESKVGDVEVESPLVEGKITGGLYVAKQHQNPYGNLLTLYLIARNEELGVLIRQALKVVPDPVTGQLTTEVDNVPELPFSTFHLSFRQGQRSPLVTPPACGPYTVKALLYPWSNPGAPVERESSFQITQGPEGQGCPSGGVPPFHPNLLAGSENPTAGAYSPFYTDITRKDSEQEITRFSIKLPPGVAGKLAGVSECSDGAIALAKSREVEGGGSVEENNPSCPKNSEVGHSLVGSGVGNVLAYAPGKLYLAGPYHGSNISLVSITAAKVGPFDLGTVVVRFALKIDPETAEVSVDGRTSDPIPHIVDGIPVHLRDIRAYVDRPNFTYNPTSCAKKSTASTILGSGLDFASSSDDQPVTVTSPFQAADCASLGFKPKLKLSLKGKTHRGAHPAFKAVLTYPKKGAYANIARSVVALPHSEFLENAHIRTICTRVQFAAGAGNGSQCPAASVYGRARAVTPILSEPLEGPVYLRSSEHKLPDLVAALHNNQVNIDLDGRIDSINNGQIRNTFEAVPDAPVSKFVLEMQGGNKGLLVNSTNLCKSTNHAISEFTGQNGKIYNTTPVLQVKCGKKGKKKSKAKHHH